jgi:pilus assembly protein CpaB
MRIRIIGAVIAVVLAAIGAVALVLYVNDADVRAANGAELVQVFVVKEDGIPKGTPGEEIRDLVEIRRLPQSAILDGRVTQLTELDGLVAAADLLPGEQIVLGRFQDPLLLAARGDITVPDGMQEITIALPVDQAAGGVLVPGSTVGILISQTGATNEDPSTKFVLHKVLVTRVQGGTNYVPSADPNDPQDPVSSIMVTLALTTPDIERIAWAAELQQDDAAGIWLTLEPDDADEDDSKTINGGNVFE